MSVRRTHREGVVSQGTREQGMEVGVGSSEESGEGEGRRED